MKSPFTRPHLQPTVDAGSAWGLWIAWAILTVGGFWFIVWLRS